MVGHGQKITFGEMRAAGVTAIIVFAHGIYHGFFAEVPALLTFSGFLSVSTELAKRAVSSMCLAGLCDWSLIAVGFEPSSAGFRDMLILHGAKFKPRAG